MSARIKSVVDTNIFVSSLLKNGPSRTIIDLWLDGRLIIVTSPALFDELVVTLKKDKISSLVSESETALLLDTIQKKALFVNPLKIVAVSRDKSDDMVFACALEAKVDFLISGDKDVLSIKEFHGIITIPPKEFIALIHK